MPSPTLGSVRMNSKVYGGKILSIQIIDDASHFFRSKRAFLEKFPTQRSEIREYRNLKHSNSRKKISNNQIINKLSQNRDVSTTYSYSVKPQIAFMTSVRSIFPVP